MTEPVAAVEEFVAPRAALLASGDLRDFAERIASGRVERHGDIASWWGTYAKTGLLRGASAAGSGVKGIHLVRRGGRWRITSVVWQDD